MNPFCARDELIKLTHKAHDSGHCRELFKRRFKARRLRLPMSSDRDQRKLSWLKLCDQVDKKLVNNVSSWDDCWFVAANEAGSNGGSTFTKKLDDGKSNKWALHRMLHVLFNPQRLSQALRQAHTHRASLWTRPSKRTWTALLHQPSTHHCHRRQDQSRPQRLQVRLRTAMSSHTQVHLQLAGYR